MTALTNWAGNHTYSADRVARPATVEELQETVATARRAKALGTGHSFTDVADTDGVLISTARLPSHVQIDADSRTASVAGGASCGAVASELQRQGWALANLASLPHISLAGAIATGTHGSGDRNGSLSAAVGALDIVGPDGELRTLRRGQPDFDGSIVALGALGIVSRLKLDIEPSYDIAQTVYTNLSWDLFEDRFDDLTRLGYSVSLFTHFDERGIRQMWVKRRLDVPSEGLGAGLTRAQTTLHMLDGAPADAVTEQGGIPGPWVDRLPHFRMDFTPSRGEELQSEYLVPRTSALAALRALRELAVRICPLLQAAEIRTVAADDLWLSSSYACDVVGIHFTWVKDVDAVLAALGPVEEALLPMGARPHWGKLFRADASDLGRLYPRLGDFRNLRDRVDPNRKFSNAFLERTLS